MKSIIKEIIIILLLCIAICLILGVIFYNYIPVNIVVPSNVEAYTTSDTIKEDPESSLRIFFFIFKTFAIRIHPLFPCYLTGTLLLRLARLQFFIFLFKIIVCHITSRNP